MNIQIFKTKIPDSLVFQLLEAIAIKGTETNTNTGINTNTNVVYTINKNVYKKGVFNSKIAEFYEACKPYYHISKRKYLDKKMSYNSFITVIRQICNSNKITYTSQIKYDKSDYDIVYCISLPVVI